MGQCGDYCGGCSSGWIQPIGCAPSCGGSSYGENCGSGFNDSCANNTCATSNNNYNARNREVYYEKTSDVNACCNSNFSNNSRAISNGFTNGNRYGNSGGCGGGFGCGPSFRYGAPSANLCNSMKFRKPSSTWIRR